MLYINMLYNQRKGWSGGSSPGRFVLTHVQVQCNVGSPWLTGLSSESDHLHPSLQQSARTAPTVDSTQPCVTIAKDAAIPGSSVCHATTELCPGTPAV